MVLVEGDGYRLKASVLKTEYALGGELQHGAAFYAGTAYGDGADRGVHPNHTSINNSDAGSC